MLMCRRMRDDQVMRLYDYSASPNAYKVRLLIGRLGLEVERVEVDIFAGRTLTDEYRAINPARTVPVLEAPDGRLLPDSGAILWFLAAGSPLLPADEWTRAQTLRWMFFEQADVVPAIGGLRFRLQTGRLQAGRPEAEARRSAALEVLSVLDGQLARGPFLTGEEETIADIAVFGYTHVAHEADLPVGDFPNVGGWLARMRERPGHVDDLAPYPPSARPGAGRSIYDG